MTDDDASTDTDAARGQVLRSAAEIYESFFVPALFGQFPAHVLDHAGVSTGDSVLDVGCGTGVLARAAQRRVGGRGVVAAVDLNDGMLDVARRHAPTIDWRSAVAESLPFDDGSFGHSISAFAAMFFTDRRAAIDEMARVTRPGGAVTVVTWSGLDRTPGYAEMIDVISTELGDDAADALRAPFTLGDPDDVQLLLDPIDGGARVDEISGTARFSSIADWVHTDVRGWTLAALVDDVAEARLVARAERELAHFVTPAGAVEFPAPAIVGTACVGD